MPPEAQDLRIEPLREGDWERIAEILREGIATGNATFETTVPTEREWDGSHLPEPRFGARLGDHLVAWVALGPVSSRACYRGVAEVSLYVDRRHRSRGIGRRLLQGMIPATERCGIWTLQGMLFPENVASIRLLDSCGFETVGVRKRMGRLNGRWRDVLLMERRSPVTE